MNHKQKVFIIYLITDLVTKKHYVGCTELPLRTKFINYAQEGRGRKKRKIALHIRAVLGNDYTNEQFEARFKITELNRTTSEAIAEFYEHNYIGIYNSYWDGYNATMTGRSDGSHLRNKPISDEHREKISKTTRGRPKSAETKRRMSLSSMGKNKGEKGWKFRHDVSTLDLVNKHEGGMTFRALGKLVGMHETSVAARIKQFYEESS